MNDDARTSGANGAKRPALDQGRLELALTAAEMGEFEFNAVNDQFIVSERMAWLTGVPAGVMPGHGGNALYAFVHPDDLARVRGVVDESLEQRRRYDVAFRMFRPDSGKLRWMESSAIGVRFADGALDRVIGVVRDVSKRKARDDEREALVAELDHRVKNVLATVQSLAAQSARRTVSLEAFLKTFAGRLEAMAAAHTLLTSTRWRGADIGDIAAAELGGLAYGQARWEGPEIALNPRATNALTLALHELGTNAVKYGALSTGEGRIELSWRHRKDGGFELIWTERNGPPVSPPGRHGFGATLLERVTGRELGGSANLEFRPEGVRAVLLADATALTGEADLDDMPGALARGVAEDAAVAGASVGDLPGQDIREVRVLIVEDAVLLALELESGLIEAGAVVVASASSLEEALTMAALDFDVAVLDANLNGRSVKPMAMALSALGKPFIFATGYDEAAAPPEGFEAPVVRKPYNIRQIAGAIASALHENGTPAA
ncbi:MAG: HWE histidine kinase domain-containing protein [Caulobacteraceae bacterium]